VAAICLLAGCRATRPGGDTPAPRDGVRLVTFNADIAPILLDHCATCHRPVQSRPVATPPSAGAPGDPVCIAGAPFSLLNYADAYAHANEIAQATLTRAMPPWLPEPGYGDFLNTRRLTDEQVDLIQRWVAQSAPEGDAAQRPAPPVFAEGWQLGKPDLVLTAEAYTLRPGTGDVFRNFVLPVPVSAARYVRAIEFRANNPRVIHHANVAVDPDRVSRLLDRTDPGPGFAIMPEDEVQNVYGWSPGKVPVLEPEDTAWTLEEGSDLVIQLHMVPAGQAEIVRPSLGLFFSTTPPTRVPIVVKLESKSIDIPPGDSSYVVEDSYVLPADVSVVSVYPHAHYLARDMRGVATFSSVEFCPHDDIPSAAGHRDQSQKRRGAPQPVGRLRHAGAPGRGDARGEGRAPARSGLGRCSRPAGQTACSRRRP